MLHILIQLISFKFFSYKEFKALIIFLQLTKLIKS